MHRIDVTLGLPALDRGRRIGVWHNHIQDLFDEDAISMSQSADLRLLAEQKWSKGNMNGHHIKKAITTARVLADKKGRMVGAREIETMLKIGREFEERAGYLEIEEEKETGKEIDKGDLEGFEQVEKP